MVSASRSSAVFGKRKEPHTVIIARGNEIRHFTVRPWLSALVGSAFAAAAIGYLLATTYLVMRDDLLSASVAHSARLQQAYEDRISALRTQVDRITSRQLLDQQLMERKVAELLERHGELAGRAGRLGAVLERAGGAGLPAAAPVPSPKPGENQAAAASAFSLAGLDPEPTGSLAETSADRADRLFVTLNRSLRDVETSQRAEIQVLAEDAWRRVGIIGEAVRAAGLSLDVGDGKTGVGGPLLTADPTARFDEQVKELDAALDQLEAARTVVNRYPLGNPAPGAALSSTFGSRTDPILGTPAFHAGLDFRAGTGDPIKATAAGTIVKAGWNGGYGQMVEIDHGKGFTTRYAHMSYIAVAPGQKVAAGTVIGKAGSTGRSTGPHLHYEVRRAGEAVDPLAFLKAGRRLAEAL